MPLVYAGVLSHAPGITGRADLVENTDAQAAFYQALSNQREEIAATKTSEEWLVLLDEHNIPAMRYNKIEDVLTDPHLEQVGFWQEREGEKTGKYRTIKHPVHYSASPANIFADPPTLGADNEEVRGAIGVAANDQ